MDSAAGQCSGARQPANINDNNDRDEDGDRRLVYIQPYGGQDLLPITRRAARLSGYLQDIIQLIDQQAFREDQNKQDHRAIIPLQHQQACNTDTMKNIIRWCEYHCDDPKLNENIYEDLEEDEYSSQEMKKPEEPLPSYWDRRFLSDVAGDEDPVNGWMNRADLYDLLIAAHFLQIQPIVEIGGKFICQAIRERNVDQVRTFLGIINDLSEEEIRSMSNDWPLFNR